MKLLKKERTRLAEASTDGLKVRGAINALGARVYFYSMWYFLDKRAIAV